MRKNELEKIEVEYKERRRMARLAENLEKILAELRNSYGSAWKIDGTVDFYEVDNSTRYQIDDSIAAIRKAWAAISTINTNYMLE